MRLSEAIMLGSTTCVLEAGDWNSCALGAACNALGVPADFIGTEVTLMKQKFRVREFIREDEIAKYWPWLTGELSFFVAFEGVDRFSQEPWLASTWLEMIYVAFDDLVACGHWSLEALVDWVRSVEPECGECCEFECTCGEEDQAEAVRAAKEEACQSVELTTK